MDDRTNDYDFVARLYDAYVTVDRDLDFFREEASAASAVLELMAGTGRVTPALLRGAADVTCLDYSLGMLRLLAGKFAHAAVAPHVVCGDVRRLPIAPGFDLVVIPFNAFAEVIDAADRAATLDEVWRALVPGGNFICTLHNPTVRRRTLDGEDRVAGTFRTEADERWEMSVCGTADENGDLATSRQRYRRLGPADEVLEDFTQHVRFALVSRAELEEAATRRGFVTHSLFGDYDRTPFYPEKSPFMIWVLERPA